MEYRTTPEDREHAQGFIDREEFYELLDCIVEASDGCRVEPDGVCEHGCPSPLLVLGMI